MSKRSTIHISVCICICMRCFSWVAAEGAASASRPSRQVVQPTWLTRPDLVPSSQAAKVSVTSQNLQEAANIRATIQKAVDEGNYVVASSPQQFLVALSQMSNAGFLGAPMTLPIFTLPNANWWRPQGLFG
ncbi:uncharacterized protein LOC116805540 [Drosophila grimshawi]|uniref:uncharacterized protein LOC116805540 n=1 Tax=Drosophila grimshawi TaxID=7222 RepID=UPI000C87028E|nr:uncharacterized protein LOC116805540 [Drosophila grimshawi]